MTDSPLTNLYATHQEKVSDKWAIYLSTYERILSPYRKEPINLLEIGIQNGGSLEIWGKFFENARNLVGNDINEKCADLRFDDARISLIIGDATQTDTAAKIREKCGTFNIIIDDGSHTSPDIIKAFFAYFPLLEEDGVFIIEDLHCSYWSEYEGGLFHPFSSMNFLKMLADSINYEHWGIAKTRSDFFSSMVEKYGIQFDESIPAQVHSIEFVNSICVIRKKKAQLNQLGERIVTGQHDHVFDGIPLLNGSIISAKPQTGHFWSDRALQPAEELISSIEEKSKLLDSLSSSEALINERASEIEKLCEKYMAAQSVAEERALEIKALSDRFISAHSTAEERAKELQSTSNALISAKATAEERAHELEQIVARLISAQATAEERASEIRSLAQSLISAQAVAAERTHNLVLLQERISKYESSPLFKLARILKRTGQQ